MCTWGHLVTSLPGTLTMEPRRFPSGLRDIGSVWSVGNKVGGSHTLVILPDHDARTLVCFLSFSLFVYSFVFSCLPPPPTATPHFFSLSHARVSRALV